MRMTSPKHHVIYAFFHKLSFGLNVNMRQQVNWSLKIPLHMDAICIIGKIQFISDLLSGQPDLGFFSSFWGFIEFLGEEF